MSAATPSPAAPRERNAGSVNRFPEAPDAAAQSPDRRHGGEMVCCSIGCSMPIRMSNPNRLRLMRIQLGLGHPVRGANTRSAMP